MQQDFRKISIQVRRHSFSTYRYSLVYCIRGSSDERFSLMCHDHFVYGFLELKKQTSRISFEAGYPRVFFGRNYSLVLMLDTSSDFSNSFADA